MRVPELELELEFEFNATAELELELVNSSVALHRWPPVVSNVRFANSLLGFLIEPARVGGPQSRRGMLSSIM